MNITLEKVNTNIKPPKDTSNLVVKIHKLWDRLDQDRQKQIDIIKKVQEHRDFSKNNKLGDVKEIGESTKAHIWNSMFKSLSSSFNCNSKSDEEREFTQKQKANILNALEKSKSDEEFLKALDYHIYKGEFITFTTWLTNYKLVRRKSDIPILDEFGQPTGATKKSFQVFQQPYYEGVKIKAIEPESFVFDTSRADDFDNCPKIYKTWATIQDIKENQIYKDFLNNEQITDLENCVENAEDKKDNTNIDDDKTLDKNKGFKDDQIEILEYWGSINVNGDYLKNMLIVVVGRKYIARFEYNPYIINPFVWCPDEEDPDTGRGIPKLYDIVSINNDATEIFQKLKTALGLMINKPFLAPKGAFTGQIKVKEGAIIEYDPTLMSTPPVPLDFTSAFKGFDFLQYFEGKAEQLTGMYKYATGDDSGVKRTATESSQLVSAQNVRLALKISILGKKGFIPTIERVAELLANFKDGIETAKVMIDGQEQFVTIDNTIRQGEYEYSLGDSQSIIEKKAKSEEQRLLAKEFIQSGLKLSLPRLWEYFAGGSFEMENPMSYIENDPLTEMLNQEPEELREPIKQALAQYLPLIKQEIMNANQPQETTGNPNETMDINRVLQ